MSASFRTNPTVAASGWMIGAILSFCTLAVAGRFVRTELDSFELMAYRSALGIIIVLAAARASGTFGQINRRNLGLHLLRNISHFAGQNLWFYAVALIPLAQLFALEFTTPIWVTLLAPILLAETLTRIRLVAALIGFIGVLVVTHPDPANLNPGTIAAALCAIGFAGSILFTKRLTRSASVTCILFWLTAMQTVMGFACALADGPMAWPTAPIWGWIAVVSIAGLSAHFCLTRALQVAPASVVMPMDFLRLPAIALVGYLLFNEPLEWTLAAGGALIVIANLMNIRHASRLTRPA